MPKIQTVVCRKIDDDPLRKKIEEMSKKESKNKDNYTFDNLNNSICKRHYFLPISSLCMTACEIERELINGTTI